MIYDRKSDEWGGTWRERVKLEPLEISERIAHRKFALLQEIKEKGAR